MSAALKTVESLSPEALAFIKEGIPRPQVEKPVVAAPAPISAPRLTAQEPQPAAEPIAESPKASRGRVTVAKDESVPVPGVVGLTFRLPVEIHQLLLRASFERKFKRQRPWTQQEIAAEAFTAWLKKGGYL